MSSAFSDAQISKWVNEYERELCATHDLICDRYSVGITAGVSQYEIPNYITNIRFILWQGKEVFPKGLTTSTMTGDTPFVTTSTSRPLEYIFSGLGLRTLKFIGTPSVAIAEYTGNLFTPAADAAAVIVEFYRTPSITDAKLRLPVWLRRYLVKDYVCLKGFRNGGPRQDLRAAEYYEAKAKQNMEYLKKVKTNMYQSYINVLSPDNGTLRGRPARPVLPDNFARN